MSSAREQNVKPKTRYFPKISIHLVLILAIFVSVGVVVFHSVYVNVASRPYVETDIYKRHGIPEELIIRPPARYLRADYAFDSFIDFYEHHSEENELIGEKTAEGIRIGSTNYYYNENYSSEDLVPLAAQGNVVSIDVESKTVYLEHLNQDGTLDELTLYLGGGNTPLFLVDYYSPNGETEGPYIPGRTLTPATFEDIQIGDWLTHNIESSLSPVGRVLIDKNEN